MFRRRMPLKSLTFRKYTLPAHVIPFLHFRHDERLRHRWLRNIVLVYRY